jgi:hypothetical protein
MKLERRKKEVWAEIIIYYDEYVYNKESTREPTYSGREKGRQREERDIVSNMKNKHCEVFSCVCVTIKSIKVKRDM